MTTIVVCLSAGGAVVLAQTGPQAPTTPAWVKADRTVDVASVPDLIPVGGSDGAIVGYVDSKALMGPPAGGPASAVDVPPGPPVVVDAAGRPVGLLTSEGFRATGD